MAATDILEVEQTQCMILKHSVTSLTNFSFSKFVFLKT